MRGTTRVFDYNTMMDFLTGDAFDYDVFLHDLTKANDHDLTVVD